MALINLTGITTEAWTHLEDDMMPEANTRVTAPLARLVDETESFFAAVEAVGALVPTDADWRTLAPLAGKLSFVVIAFPAFGDGRGFSLAVRLRKDLGFTGEIRATGPVIPDQAIHLMRSGFDTVEVDDRREAAFKAALKRYSVFYQSDYTGRTALTHARHAVAERRPEQQRKAS